MVGDPLNDVVVDAEGMAGVPSGYVVFAFGLQVLGIVNSNLT